MKFTTKRAQELYELYGSPDIIPTGANGKISMADILAYEKRTEKKAIAASANPFFFEEASPEEVGATSIEKTPASQNKILSERMQRFAQHVSLVRGLRLGECFQYAIEHNVMSPEQAIEQPIDWLRELAFNWSKANPA